MKPASTLELADYMALDKYKKKKSVNQALSMGLAPNHLEITCAWKAAAKNYTYMLPLTRAPSYMGVQVELLFDL